MSSMARKLAKYDLSNVSTGIDYAYHPHEQGFGGGNTKPYWTVRVEATIGYPKCLGCGADMEPTRGVYVTTGELGYRAGWFCSFSCLPMVADAWAAMESEVAGKASR